MEKINRLKQYNIGRTIELEILPLVCVMIAGRETQNNGIMKMLALPVDRQTLSLAKFCVLVFYLFMEMVVFFVVFIVAGWLVTPV